MAEDTKVMNIDPFFNNSVEQLDRDDQEEPQEEDPIEEEDEEPEGEGDQDTSDEESDDDTDDDPEEDDEDEEEEQPKPRSNKKQKRDDWKQKYDAAEKHRRDMQAERDMLRNQVNQQLDYLQRMENRLVNIEQTTQGGVGDNFGIDGDDDNLVTVAELKKLMQAQRKQAPKSAPQQESSTNISRAEQDWANSQDDFEEIAEYASKKGLSYKPDVAGLPTNLVGRYQAARAMKAREEAARLKAENEKLVKQVKKLKKRTTKPKMPTIGGGSYPTGKGRSTSNMDPADRFWSS